VSFIIILLGNDAEATKYWTEHTSGADVMNRAAFKRLQSRFPDLINHDQYQNVLLTMFTDGAPITDSSGNCIWPVMFVINNFDPKIRKKFGNIIFGGLWLDNHEPNFQYFLTPIAEQLRDLAHKPVKARLGAEVKEVHAFLLLVCGDTPAKLKMLGLYNFNSGVGGCNACNQKPAQVIYQGNQESTRKRKKKNGYKPKKKMVYPYSDDIFCYQSKEDLMVETQKLKYKSPLIEFLDYFDPVTQCPIDPMHTCWLGVAKKFMKLWFTPSSDKRSARWRLNRSQIAAFEQRMRNIKTPIWFSRAPRGYDSGSWKGTSHVGSLKVAAVEYKNFVLYFFPVVMADLLPRRYYEHFMLFVRVNFLENSPYFRLAEY
jgi:hypothetical protein